MGISSVHNQSTRCLSRVTRNLYAGRRRQADPAAAFNSLHIRRNLLDTLMPFSGLGSHRPKRSIGPNRQSETKIDRPMPGRKDPDYRDLSRTPAPSAEPPAHRSTSIDLLPSSACVWRGSVAYRALGERDELSRTEELECRNDQQLLT
jgi:hypothetical protein